MTMNFLNAPDVRFLHVDLFRTNPLQPGQRTSKEKLAALVASMRDATFFVPIVAIYAPRYEGDDRPYVIVDGHRRWTAARELGATEIHCIVIEGDPGYEFVRLNCGNLKFDEGTWWTVWSFAESKATRAKLPFPSKVLNAIVQLTTYAGNETDVADWGKELGQRGFTPNYFVAPVSMLINAAKHHNLTLTKHQVRELLMEFFEAARAGKTKFRPEVMSRTAAKAAVADANPAYTWTGCTPAIFTRELNKLLSGKVRTGAARIILK